MTKLIKDEKTIEVVDENKIVVTRTMVEEYDTEEYTRTFFRLEQSIEQFKAQLEETEKMLVELSANGVREKVEANAEVLREKNLKEREADIAKIKKAVNGEEDAAQ